MNTRTKKWLAMALSLLVLTAALAFATRLLTPKRHDFGSTWGQFLQEEENSLDVLFFGSSLVYCDVAPAALWGETGLASYVLAGPEQTVPMSYYSLKQALKTQSPQAVFMEITGVFYPRYTQYTKVNVGYLPMGKAKLAAIFNEAEPALRGGLLFPLIFYHDRWSGLCRDDFKVALRGYEADALAGYTYVNTYCQTTGVYERTLTRDEENEGRNLEFLRRAYALCRQEGITPVFYIAPSLGRMPRAAMDRVKTELAAWDGAYLLDCNEVYAQIALDEKTDYYDTLHFNAAGAEKFTDFLGTWLGETLPLTPTQPSDSSLWQGRTRAWQDCIALPPQPPAAKEDP